MNSDENSGPALSVILPTDTFETIDASLEHYRRQTVAGRLEIILVMPPAHAEAARRVREPAFAAVRVVEISSLAPLGHARAAGVRAASAPFIFVGETHSFMPPESLEMLLAAAAEGPWAAVVPGFENANPTGVISWSAFLAAYARWSARRPAGEIDEAPLYDSLYRRDVLLEAGDRLGPMLSFGDGLPRALQAGGHRIYFLPAARIGHMNMERLAISAYEYFLIGLMIGAQRVGLWPFWRRLVYIGGAGLIPAVLVWRTWPGARQAARGTRLPAGTFATFVFLMVAKAAGELIGYLGGGTSRDKEVMTHYEVHRADFVRRRDWKRGWGAEGPAV